MPIELMVGTSPIFEGFVAQADLSSIVDSGKFIPVHMSQFNARGGVMLDGGFKNGQNPMDSSLKPPETSATNMNDQPVFLLLEKNPIIAADMIGTLEACCDCHVVHVAMADEIDNALAQTPAVAAAFLEMNFRDLEASDLPMALNQSGARIVLTQGEAHEAEVQRRGWHMLVRPFSDEMVRDMLQDMQLPLR